MEKASVQVLYEFINICIRRHLLPCQALPVLFDQCRQLYEVYSLKESTRALQVQEC